MKPKLLLAGALLLVMFVGLVGVFALGSYKAKRASEAEQLARLRAQEVAEMVTVQRRDRRPPRGIAPMTATVRGRLHDKDGNPLPQRTLGIVKEGLRIGDADFSFMSDGLTGEDGSFRFEMPMGQSWQALLPQGGAFDGPRSDGLRIDAPGVGTTPPTHELELRLDGMNLNGRLTPLPAAATLRR